MRRDKNIGAVFMKLFLVPALFLAGLLISINPVHAEATWQNTFEYFNLDEPASGQTDSCGQLKSMPVIDSSPNALNRDIPQASLCTTDGKFGQALYPNNGNAIFSGPDNKHAAKIGKMSFSFWIKIVGPLSGADQVWNQDSCTNNGDFFQIEYRYWDNKIHLTWNNLGGHGVDYATLNWNVNNINDGQWHNIIIEYDIGTGPQGWYVDGVEQDAGMYAGWPYTEQYSWQVIFPDAIPGNLDSFSMGCVSYISMDNHGLAIDDLAIVQDEITPDQIALLQTESYGDMLGVKPAQIPNLNSLGQFKSDGTTAIAEGGGTAGKVILQGTPTSPSGNQVQLQVEVKSVDSAFNGTPTASGTLAASGQAALITISNLSVGQYHWQGRAVDSQGNASPWQTMSNPVATTDFSILRAPLIVIPGILGSQKVLGQWVMDPILHSYDNLWLALKLAGYTEDKTLFDFPYDWRQSNTSSALLLKQKISDVKAACSLANLSGYDCGKVDLVAHSMGGLVARAYAESNNYQNDINQLIFLATPQNGAPQAYLGWEGGSFGKDTTGMFIDTMLGMQAKYYNYKNVFEYVRNLPIQSVRELLPTYNYLQDKGLPNFRIYPNNYPTNIFLENLNAQSNLNKLSGIKITNILADAGNNKTINSLRLVNINSTNGQWAEGYPDGYNNLLGDNGLIKGDGDNTVPKISNSNFFGQQDVVVYDSAHGSIPTDAQKEVIKDLTGTEPLVKIVYYPLVKTFTHFLIFAIFSPADFVITSPNGQQLGKNFSGNTEVNQIPNAYYSGFTDDPEFVVIPNPVDGQYKVQLQGKNGGGNYHVQASYINDSTSTVKDFSANIAQGQNQTLNLNCASNSLQLIVNLVPKDTDAPSIVINAPTSGTKYFHSDKLQINYTASDDFSGVASVTVAIDGNILNTPTVDLFNYALGVHKISIKAADRDGNQAVKTVSFEIVANIDSAIYDVKAAYNKKWLIKELDKNTLILSLDSLKLSLDFLAAEKAVLEKLINDTQNNKKLSAAAKKKIIEPLEKLLDANSNARQAVIKNVLGDFQKNLDKIKQKNGINQPGYDIIKADIDYLKNNLQ